MIGQEILHHPFNQSDFNIKPIFVFFFCTIGNFLLFSLSSYLLVVILALVLISPGHDIGIGFVLP